MMVFNKILGRWQKLWWRKKKLMAKAQVFEKKKLQSGPLTAFCISSILEQKLECLDRKQTSLNFVFLTFIQ